MKARASGRGVPPTAASDGVAPGGPARRRARPGESALDPGARDGPPSGRRPPRARPGPTTRRRTAPGRRRCRRRRSGARPGLGRAGQAALGVGVGPGGVAPRHGAGQGWLDTRVRGGPPAARGWRRRRNRRRRACEKMVQFGSPARRRRRTADRESCPRRRTSTGPRHHHFAQGRSGLGHDRDGLGHHGGVARGRHRVVRSATAASTGSRGAGAVPYCQMTASKSSPVSGNATSAGPTAVAQRR